MLFFCLLCVRVRDNCSLKTVHIFHGIPDLRTPPPPPRPPTWKKLLKLKIKKIQKKERKENQLQAYLRWNPFSDFASFDPNFKNPSPDFPIEYAGPSIFRS